MDAWWRLYSEEPSDNVIAESIFKVIIAVGDGIVTVDQMKA